jgi:hypothetical protein
LRPYEGALRLDFFSPRVVALLALRELAQGKGVQEAGRFLQWYADHINYLDKNCLFATMYDYKLVGDKDVRTRKYNAVDNSAGSFLSLLEQYILLSGDTQLFEQNRARIDDIAYLVAYMRDKEDGLTRALPNFDRKYLANNCEAYLGIKAYNRLCQRLHKGKWKGKDFYLSVEKGLEICLGGLYNPEYRSFNWLVDDREPHAADWEIWRPGVFAQVFPLYAGILDHDRARAEAIWRELNGRYAEEIAKLPWADRVVYEMAKDKLQKQWPGFQ